MNARSLFLLSALLLAAVIPAAAQDLTAILNGSFIFAPTPHASLRFRMTIHDALGDKERVILVSVANDDGGRRFLARITAPASLSGLKYLRIEPAKGAVQQWLRTSRGVLRLGEGSGSERLFGSDLTIEDISKVDPGAHRLARVADLEDDSTYVVSLEPLDGKSPGKIVAIDRETSLIMAAGTPGPKGTIAWTYRVEERRTANSAAYPARARFTDPERGTWTLLEILSIDLSTPIPDRLFNPAGL